MSGQTAIDTTETFDRDAGTSWVTSGAKLPRPMYYLTAANIDGRVLFFGIYTFYHTPDISVT